MRFRCLRHHLDGTPLPRAGVNRLPPDDYPVVPGEPDEAVQRLITKLLEIHHQNASEGTRAAAEAARDILNGPADELAAAFTAIADRTFSVCRTASSFYSLGLTCSLLEGIVVPVATGQREVRLGSDDVCDTMRWIGQCDDFRLNDLAPQVLLALLPSVRLLAPTGDLIDAAKQMHERLKPLRARGLADAQRRLLMHLIPEHLATEKQKTIAARAKKAERAKRADPPHGLQYDEGFADRLTALIEQERGGVAAALGALLARPLHEGGAAADERSVVTGLSVRVDVQVPPPPGTEAWTARAMAAAPDASWCAALEELTLAHGAETVRGLLHDLLAAALKSKTGMLNRPGPNRALLCAAIWAACHRPTGETHARLVRFGAHAIENRLTHLNTVLLALANRADDDALATLCALQLKAKRPSPSAILKAFVAHVAARRGVAEEDLQERFVPTYELGPDGTRSSELGGVTGTIRIIGSCDTALGWSAADGRTLKSPPAAARREHADGIKQLKAVAQDMAAALRLQRDRIDGLYLRNRIWPIGIWRERYLDHPLVGQIARRLMWEFADGAGWAAGMWRDGSIRGSDGRALATESCREVRLWHPIDQTAEQVSAWRDRLEADGVTQPFKQAHREVYPLTQAERTTVTYSNRYAAHLLKQHQFNALALARGWRYRLHLVYDGSYPPASRIVAHDGLRAEFWVNGAGHDLENDATPSGAHLLIATDQVRFCRGIAEPHPIPLEEIPPLVFSEIMRDVDLFVGVASVGNDPNWLDQAARPERRDYWNNYSFGELSGTAQTRKAVLQRLVPRLKIAPRCSFDDKFLKVRGELRTYKIHLGSGNILMEPNDQYLCIVPKQAAVDTAGGKVFLPFEGDRTLSIILSKAMLLADDGKITDPTITRQIAMR